jgi:hypothetical protein
VNGEQTAAPGAGLLREDRGSVPDPAETGSAGAVIAVRQLGRARVIDRAPGRSIATGAHKQRGVRSCRS